MDHNTIHLPWGDEHIHLNLPDGWRVAGVLEPSVRAGVTDPRAEAARALRQPVGSPRLSELARPGIRIALVIDDISRPTPVAQFLPAVLEELEAGGASRAQITVVPALGLHRAMSAEEVAGRIGPECFAGMSFDSPDCDDPQKLVSLGVTTRGTPVLINKTVAEADLVVSVGCIEPHIIASFGGGYKNIVPGVAGRATVAHNHALNCAPATFNMVGQPIEQNPMRLDLEEAAGKIRGQVFIVNAVLNSSIQVVEVVCGHPVAAHRAGCAVSAGIYGACVPARADVIITASHPMDSDLRQGVKALANTVRAVKPGGVMITTVRATEGTGVFGLANKKLPLGRRPLKALAPLLLPLVPKLKIRGMGEEDKFFLYFALQAMNQSNLYMYAPTIPAATKENLPFLTFFDTPEAALEQARKRFTNKADVLVFPHGGMTYPILPQ